MTKQEAQAFVKYNDDIKNHRWASKPQTTQNKSVADIIPNLVAVFIMILNYNNLLGGLYRENPVKSRNYEAVKSSKKWENVGNSYIIPALLLYRYSYI